MKSSGSLRVGSGLDMATLSLTGDETKPSVRILRQFNGRVDVNQAEIRRRGPENPDRRSRITLEHWAWKGPAVLYPGYVHVHGPYYQLNCSLIPLASDPGGSLRQPGRASKT